MKKNTINVQTIKRFTTRLKNYFITIFIEAKKKRKKIISVSIILVIILLFFSQCTNKTVILTRQGNYGYLFESNLITSGNNGELCFTKPFDDLDVYVYFYCEEKPLYIKIRSIELQIDKLDLNVKKNVNKDLLIQESKNQYDANYEAYYFCNEIKLEDLKNEYRKKSIFPVTNLFLYNKFRGVNLVKTIVEFEYELNGVVYTHSYMFPYYIRNKTTFKILDAIESV